MLNAEGARAVRTSDVSGEQFWPARPVLSEAPNAWHTEAERTGECKTLCGMPRRKRLRQRDLRAAAEDVQKLTSSLVKRGPGAGPRPLSVDEASRYERASPPRFVKRGGGVPRFGRRACWPQHVQPTIPRERGERSRQGIAERGHGAPGGHALCRPTFTSWSQMPPNRRCDDRPAPGPADGGRGNLSWPAEGCCARPLWWEATESWLGRASPSVAYVERTFADGEGLLCETAGWEPTVIGDLLESQR